MPLPFVSPERPAFLVYDIFLGVHIISGFIGMYGGLMPLFTPKGGEEHVQWGRIFTWAMVVAAGTAFPLAFWRQDLFQAAVGLYSGYLALFGMRVLRRHKDSVGKQNLDWAVALGSLSAFMLLSAFGFHLAMSGDPAAHANPAVGRTAFVFGFIGTLVAARDVQGLVLGNTSPARRILDHIIASSLALISAYSAFLNTQFNRMTGLNWAIDQRMLLPLIVALPFLGYWAFVWNRKLQATYRKKMNQELIPESPARKRLRVLGVAEGISLLLLLFIGTPLRHFADEPIVVKTIGPIHGGLWILYVLSVLMVAPKLNWPWQKALAAVVASVLPFGPFIFEAKMRREQQSA